jgi:hypothetical protein
VAGVDKGKRVCYNTVNSSYSAKNKNREKKL